MSSLAAVGCAEGLTELLIWFSNGVALGCLAVGENYHRSGDVARFRNSVKITVLMGIAVSAVITVFGVLLTRPILGWLQTPAPLLDEAESFLKITFFGAVSTVSFHILAHLSHFLGDRKTPLTVSLFACVGNVTADVLLLKFCNFGVAGIAVTTVLFRSLAAMICLICLLKKFPTLRSCASPRIISLKEWKTHLRKGLSLGARSLVLPTGILGVQIVLNGLGIDEIAAYAAAEKIESFALLPLQSLGSVVAVSLGKNAELYHLRRKITGSVGINFGLALVFASVVQVFGEEVVSFFAGSHHEILELAHHHLIVGSVGYLVFALIPVFRNTLQSAKMEKLLLLTAGIESLVRVICSVWFASVEGFRGLCWTLPISWVFAGVPLTAGVILLVHRKRRVLKQQPLPAKG